MDKMIMVFGATRFGQATPFGLCARFFESKKKVKNRNN